MSFAVAGRVPSLLLVSALACGDTTTVEPTTGSTADAVTSGTSVDADSSSTSGADTAADAASGAA